MSKLLLNIRLLSLTVHRKTNKPLEDDIVFFLTYSKNKLAYYFKK